jgi:hypothetical protein
VIVIDDEAFFGCIKLEAIQCFAFKPSKTNVDTFSNVILESVKLGCNRRTLENGILLKFNEI